VKDLAEVVVRLLEHPRAPGLAVNVAHAEVTTADGLCGEMAAVLGVRAHPLALPCWVLKAACWLAGAVAAITGRPGVVGPDKYHELVAPGWVCDTARLRTELGLDCPTPLREGLRDTVTWYREHGWL